jgi:hypothetical protein
MPFPPYPVPPAPVTWIDGPVFTSLLRNDVANAVAFLANRPSFQATCTTGPAVGGGYSPNGVALDTEVYDTWAGHWQPTDPVFWYATQPGTLGYYLAEGYVPFGYALSSTALFSAGIQYGAPNSGGGGSLTTTWGETHPVGNGHYPGPCVVDLVPLTVSGAIAGLGSAVGMWCAQNSGSPVNLLTPSNITGAPRLSLRWACALTGVAGLPVPANPAWPTPPDYIDPGSWLNPNIRDTIDYLVYPPTARLFYEAGVAKMPTGSFPAGSVVPLDTPTFDNYGGYVKNGWTAPVNGVYYLHGQVSFGAASGSGNYSAGLQVAGGTPQWGKAIRGPASSPGLCVSVTKQLRLTAGQTVQLVGAQSTGANVLLTNPGANTGPQSKLIAVWESA